MTRQSIPPKKKTTFSCPDCGAWCRVTSTKSLTPTVKEFYASCSDDACGGRYVFASEPVRCLVKSLTPNARISLPFIPAKPAPPPGPETDDLFKPKFSPKHKGAHHA